MSRVLAIDYGAARIGISLSDELKIIASDFETIQNTSITVSIERICEICMIKKVDLIILGLPLNMDGSNGFQAQEVQSFGDELEKAITIPIKYLDERLSTKKAEAIMRELKMSNEDIKNKSDAKAASVILQEYLDFN